jgi:hypothetical protein
VLKTQYVAFFKQFKRWEREKRKSPRPTMPTTVEDEKEEENADNEEEEEGGNDDEAEVTAKKAEPNKEAAGELVSGMGYASAGRPRASTYPWTHRTLILSR